MSRFAGVARLCVLVVAGVGCTTRVVKQLDEDDCPLGEERCPCGPQSSCDVGLDCRSNVCVNLGTGGTGGSGGTTSGAGGTSGSNTGPGPERTVAEYCEAQVSLAGPWCDYIAECCTEEDKADDKFVVPACSEGPESPDACLADVQTVLDAGAIWDGTWADACLAELTKLYPSTPGACLGLAARSWVFSMRASSSFSRIDACRQMLRGTTGQGDPCEYNNECPPGFTCFTLTGDVADEFQCLALGTRGSKCVTDTQCAAGLFCVGRDDLRCGDLASLGEDCLYDYQCEAGLYCSLVGTCVAPKGLGEDCEALEDLCDLGLGCGTQTMTCGTLGVQNWTCSSSLECDGRCNQGLCQNICGGSAY